MSFAPLEHAAPLDAWSSRLKVMTGLLNEQHGTEMIALVFDDTHVMLVTPRQDLAQLPKPKELLYGAFDAALQRMDMGVRINQLLTPTSAALPEQGAAFWDSLKDIGCPGGLETTGWLVDRLQASAALPPEPTPRLRSRRSP